LETEFRCLEQFQDVLVPWTVDCGGAQNDNRQACAEGVAQLLSFQLRLAIGSNRPARRLLIYGCSVGARPNSRETADIAKFLQPLRSGDYLKKVSGCDDIPFEEILAMFCPRHASDVDHIINVINRSFDGRWLQQIPRNCFDRQAGSPLEILPERTNKASDIDAAPQECFHSMTADEPRAAGNKRGANIPDLLLQLVVSLTLPTYKSIFKKRITSKAAYKHCSLFSASSTESPLDLFDKCKNFTRADEAKASGYYPYFHPIEENEGPVVTIEGRKVIMAGSNNYLGLTAHPKVKEAAIKAVEKYGTGCSGSRYLTGTLDLHVELEARLAKFFGKEDCLLYSTGFQTAQGIIPTLVQRGEFVVSDKDNHACIVAGNLIAAGSASYVGDDRQGVVRYKHNDMQHLEVVLSKLPLESPKLIVSDGV
jgi:hypothetical protein